MYVDLGSVRLQVSREAILLLPGCLWWADVGSGGTWISHAGGGGSIGWSSLQSFSIFVSLYLIWCLYLFVFLWCFMYLCLFFGYLCFVIRVAFSTYSRPPICTDLVLVVLLGLLSTVVDFSCGFRYIMVLFYLLRLQGLGIPISPQPLALPCHNMFSVGDLARVF